MKEHGSNISDIIKNKNRVAILRLLLDEKETYHTMRVSKLTKKLEVCDSMVIYHLEYLEENELVKVRKSNERGRCKWCLKTRYPIWIKTVYKKALEEYDLQELKEYYEN